MLCSHTVLSLRTWQVKLMSLNRSGPNYIKRKAKANLEFWSTSQERRTSWSWPFFYSTAVTFMAKEIKWPQFIFLRRLRALIKTTLPWVTYALILISKFFSVFFSPGAPSWVSVVWLQLCQKPLLLMVTCEEIGSHGNVALNECGGHVLFFLGFFLRVVPHGVSSPSVLPVRISQ